MLNFITKADLDVIATYMDDDKRELAHTNLMGCEPTDWINKYIADYEPELEDLIRSEFKRLV